MRKLAYFGLIVLLLGIVCVTVGAVNLQNVTSVDVGDNKIPGLTWYYTCNLTSGDSYWLYIEANTVWGEAFQDGAFTSPQPVNVTITSPGGGVTSLQAYFYSESSSSSYYREGTPPAIVGVTYESVDNSLSVDPNSNKISFSVKDSGTYNVSVLDMGWIDTPPDFFVFYKVVSPNSGNYTLLASSGGVLGIFGGVILVVSMFGKEGVRHKRTRK